MLANGLKTRWAAGPVLGAWCAIPSAVTAEIAGRAGFDYLCIDLQHGLLDYQTALAMLQAADLGGAVPLARAPANDAAAIGKLLDAGAEAVIVPLVNSAAEARAAVAACRYPPAGIRSFGPTRAALREPGYFAAANGAVAAIAQLETQAALDALDEILRVPGLDALYVGPNDLALSLGLPPGDNFHDPDFVAVLQRVAQRCRAAGIVPAIHSHAGLAARCLALGYRMVTVSTDIAALRGAFAAHLDAVRGAAGPAAGG